MYEFLCMLLVYVQLVQDPLPQAVFAGQCNMQSMEAAEEQLLPLRQALHRRLGLPLDRPLLRCANALTFAEGSQRSGDGNAGSGKGRCGQCEPPLPQELHSAGRAAYSGPILQGFVQEEGHQCDPCCLPVHMQAARRARGPTAVGRARRAAAPGAGQLRVLPLYAGESGLITRLAQQRSMSHARLPCRTSHSFLPVHTLHARLSCWRGCLRCVRCCRTCAPNR